MRLVALALTLLGCGASRAGSPLAQAPAATDGGVPDSGVATGFEYVPQLLAQSLGPTAMNDHADVVGLLEGGPVLIPHGAGAPISMLPPQASGGALPIAINRAGVVAVSARSSTGAHLVVYDSGRFTDVAAPGLDVFPFAINDANQIVGEYRPVNSTSSAGRAFLYDGASLRDLGILHGWSAAHALNGAGAAVGASDGPGGETGAYFHDGIVEDQSTPEVHVVDGQAISNSGWIAGTGSTEGIVRSPSGIVKTVGPFPEARQPL